MNEIQVSEKKKTRWSTAFLVTITAILSGVFGALFGNGVYWKLGETERALARDRDARQTAAIELRTTMQGMLLKGFEIVNSGDLSNSQKQRMLDVMEGDLAEAEKRLAFMEQRRPRPGAFEIIVPPAGPTGLRIAPSEPYQPPVVGSSILDE